MQLFRSNKSTNGEVQGSHPPYVCKTEIGKQIKKDISTLKQGQNILLPFQPKPTKTRECGRLLNIGDKIYNCYDCKRHDYACICQSCFQKGNHQTHRFAVYTKSGGGVGMCDCGNQQVWSPQGFCSDHNGHSDIINIDERQKEFFLSIFGDIFGIYFERCLGKKPIETFKKMFYKRLHQLNQGSSYYRQLTAYLLNSPLPYPQQQGKKTILEALLSTHLQHFEKLDSKLIVEAFTFQECSRSLMRSIINCYNTGYPLQSSTFLEFFFLITTKTEQIEVLAKQDLMIVSSHHRYYYHMELFFTLEKPPIQLAKCFVRKEFIKKDYKAFNALFSFLLKILRNEKQYIGILIRQLLQSPFKNLDYLVNAVLIYSNCSEQKINYKNLFNQLEVKETELQKYLEGHIEPLLFQCLNTAFYPIAFSFLYRLISQLQYGQTFYRRLLNGIIQKPGAYSDLTRINYIMKHVQYLIRGIAVRGKVYIAKAHELEIQDPDLLQKSLKVLTNIFHWRKSFSKQDFQEIVNKNARLFKDKIGDFIQQNLKFNPTTSQFTYIGPQQHSNPYNFDQITYNSRFQIDKVETKILKTMFSSKNMDTLKKNFEKMRGLNNNSSRNYIDTVIVLSIQTFVMLRSYMKDLEEFKGIEQILQQIRNGNNPIGQMLSDKSLINKILEIEQVKEEQIKNEVNFKQKAAAIKKKKFQEIKKKQEKLKQSQQFRMDQKQLSCQKQENEDICLLCHEPGIEKDRLVGFILLNKNYTVSSILGSKTAEIDIRGCNHKVHQSCFMKSYGNLNYFVCPLCKMIFNSVVPVEVDSLKGMIKQSRWAVRMQTILATTIHTQKTLFEIFLSYLIYSKAIKCFLVKNQRLTQQRHRIDSLILLILKRIIKETDSDSIKSSWEKLENQVRKQQSQNNVKCALKSAALNYLARKLDFESKQVNLKEEGFQKVGEIIGSESLRVFFKQIECQDNMKNLVGKKEQSKEPPEFLNWAIERLPKTVEEYLKCCIVKCSSCSEYKSDIWECLLCRQSSCQDCCPRVNHVKQVHHGNSIILRTSNAIFELFYLQNLVGREYVYHSRYGQNWHRKQAPLGFTATVSPIANFYRCLIENDGPENVNTQSLLSRLNIGEGQEDEQ